MKRLPFFKALIAVLPLLLVGLAFGQPDPCNIPPGEYCTYTQGGWGIDNCQGSNPACFLEANFETCFPAGITIGGDFTITFTSAAAIAAFLPTGGTSGALEMDYVDPTDPTEAGVFAGQVLGVALAVGFGDCGVWADLGHLVFPQGWFSPAGFPAGLTVDEVLAIANQVLGGDLSALPAGFTISDLSDIMTAINENFDECEVNDGFLVEPDCDEIVPVELLSFVAVSADNAVLLRWRTASERDVSHYEITRRAGNGDWAPLTTVASQGNNPSGFVYNYTDSDVSLGTNYSYRLTAHDLDGSLREFPTIASATPGSASQVTAYALHQNYPNPFNPVTSIRFDLLDAANVTLTVYNLMGEAVATLVSGEYAAGAHTVEFNAGNLATGIYLYRLEAGSFTAVRKLMLVK